MDSRQVTAASRYHRKGKLGLGTAYVKGFKYALEQGYDLVFEMDADFSHRPEHLPEFLAAIEDADLVLGCRYMEEAEQRTGDGLGGCCLAEELYARTLLTLPFKDLTGGFKCFRREVLETIDLDSVVTEGYAFQIELTYRTHKAGFRIKETPIIFPDRTLGHSKMNRKIVVEALVRLWGIRFNG